MVPRPFEWAALVVQVEAFILLVSPALALLARRAGDDPRPGLWCLVLAPVVWRVGHGVSRGSRGALAAVGTLFALRVLLTLAAGPDLGDLVLMPLEGTAITLAARAAWTEPGTTDPSWRRELRLATAVPAALALAWWLILVPLHVRRFQAEHEGSIQTPLVVLALLLLGTAFALAQRTHLGTRLVHVFRPAATLPTLRSASSALFRPFVAAVSSPPGLDFAAAMVVGGGSVALLWWFGKVSSGPGVMLVPGVLIFPLGAVAGIVSGGLWLVAGAATLGQRPWAFAVRMAALVAAGALALADGPLLYALASDAFVEWLHHI